VSRAARSITAVTDGAGPQTDGHGGRLLELAAELVRVPSVSHHERRLADLVEARLRAVPDLVVHRVGDNVLGATQRGASQRMVVAGHLDTVPPAAGAEIRLEDGVLVGVGAADMKGTLAVMLDLACAPAADVPPLDVPPLDITWCFYGCEEVERRHSGLGALWAAHPELLAGDAAILGEPTDCVLEAGCQGTMRAQVHLGGVRAHAARPWTGRNAIHRLRAVLDRIDSWAGRTVDLDGCAYVEQLQAVGVEGGVAGNVVPDHASLTLNYRFAPDRDAEGAMRFLHALFDGVIEPGSGDRIEILDAADGAPPSLDHPLLHRLLERTGAPPRAKVGWTDVASFWAHGVPAANFGAGDPLLAHHPEEQVDGASLARARQVLAAALAGEP